MSAVQWVYQQEWDLRLVRVIAHLCGWHANGCRGMQACAPRPGDKFTRRGWWKR